MQNFKDFIVLCKILNFIQLKNLLSYSNLFKNPTFYTIFNILTHSTNPLKNPTFLYNFLKFTILLYHIKTVFFILTYKPYKKLKIKNSRINHYTKFQIIYDTLNYNNVFEKIPISVFEDKYAIDMTAHLGLIHTEKAKNSRDTFLDQVFAQSGESIAVITYDQWVF